MNVWSGIGYLARDPYMDVSKTGNESCRFTLCVSRGDKEGAYTDHISCRAAGRLAPVCMSGLASGKHVGITGKLQTWTYQKEDGRQHYGYEILVDTVTFMDKKNEGEDGEDPAISD